VPLSRDDEIRLVRQILQDPTPQNPAFEDLYNAHARAIYGFIRMRSRSDQDAKDIENRAWLRVWRNLPSYDHARASLITFIRLIARNTAHEYYSRPGPDVVALEDLGEGLDRMPELASFPQDADPADRIEAIRAVWAIIFADPGPPHQVIVFIQRVLLNQKPAEIDKRRAESLWNIEEHLKSEFRRIIKLLSEADIDALFRPLEFRLSKSLDELVRDETTRRSLAHLLSRIAGGTRLEEYYKGDPSNDIGHWCETVSRRVIAAAKKRGIGGTFE